MRRNRSFHCLVSIGLLAGTAGGWAQGPPVPGSVPRSVAGSTPGPVAGSAPGAVAGSTQALFSGTTPGSSPSPAPVASLLDQAPGAPVIHYTGGLLTIEATNSSLRAILDSLSKQTGTAVQGLSHDERVFGLYGPGNPQEVLASLLDDSGYNVLISGKGADGAPREIVLTARSGNGSFAGGAAQTGHTQAADENDEDAGDNSGGVPPPQPALFTPQQQQLQQAQPGTPPSQQQVKTPQQLLEELQRLRQGVIPSGGNPQP